MIQVKNKARRMQIHKATATTTAKTRILDMGLKSSTPLMPGNLATLLQEEEKMLEWVLYRIMNDDASKYLHGSSINYSSSNNSNNRSRNRISPKPIKNKGHRQSNQAAHGISSASTSHMSVDCLQT